MEIPNLQFTALLGLSAFVIFSCSKEPDVDIDRRELCTYRDTITAPPGFKLTLIDTLDFPVFVKYFQFVNDKVGYALASKKYNYLDVLKTVDGGYHWTDLQLNVDESALSMKFISADTGIISFHDATGCPSNCQNKCVILRTTDGGLNWTKHEIQNLKGSLSLIYPDGNGHVFALLFYSQHDYTFVRSDDAGISWDTFKISEPVFNDLQTFQIFQGKMYFGDSDGMLRVINTEGVLVNTMPIPKSANYDLEILNENQFIFSTFDSLVVTDDAFQTTRTIYKGYTELIGYSDIDHVVAILNKNFCPNDVWQSNDLLAFTNDGGQFWSESQLCTNMIISFVDSHRIEDGKYVVLIDKVVYELRME